MNHPSAILQLLDGGWMILRCMAYLESDLLHRYLTSEEVEIVQGEVLLVGCLRVIAVTHVEDIVLHVLLDNKPRTTAKPKPLRCPMVWNHKPLCSPIFLPVSISMTSPGCSPR